MAYKPASVIKCQSQVQEQLCYYLTHSWEEKGFHAFLKGISPKENVIAGLEFEPAYIKAQV